MEQDRGQEELLHGGNTSPGVVRVGDTVRRPAGPHTPAVHALLSHLHAVGFEGAPHPLGIDEHGRGVLSFIPGTVPWPEEFGLLEPLDRLARVARLIRDFHDAVTGFVPPPDAQWQVLIPAEGDCDITAHHDLAPWNLVIGSRWTIIDWDLAAPGTRLWDVAYAVHGFAPLSASTRWQRPDAASRIRAFADAYGLDEAQRRELIPCSPAVPAPCTTSWPARPARTFSPGPACGKAVTATPGKLMPATSKLMSLSWPPHCSVDTGRPPRFQRPRP